MLYKIDNGLVAIDGQRYLTPVETKRSSRRSHTKTYIVPHTKTDYPQNSFFVFTVQGWNGLPNSTVTAATVNAFRGTLAQSRVIRADNVHRGWGTYMLHE